MKPHLSRPSPALVIASLALIVALGGTSYAAITLPKNSVGAKQIKKNAVTSTKVKDGSLKRADFGAGQIPAGPAGPAGAAGHVGAPGAPGVAFGVLSYRTSAIVDNPATSQDFAEAVCDAGTFAVGGGGTLSATTVGQDINSSFPSDGTGTGAPGDTGWAIFADNQTAGDQSLQAWVICAPAGAVNKSSRRSAKK